ncbi:splicing factor 3a, subunit 1 [Tritrichomonas musculus]|uniref:Splicing factor 3a, subunit 1 n=1 Tax=Tritrichomonas musculus TaxID=1915356 RepID=A0ABR2K8B9_9EUKA
MSELIIPPKIVIQTINATIPAVIKHGDTLIQHLMNDPKNASKFSFLQPDDPFFPYFQMKLEEAKSGTKKVEEAPISQKSASATAAQSNVQPPKTIPSIIPPTFSYKQPPDIGGLQLDVIHLTAQYAAMYGKEFLQVIAKQEKDSPLFNFLKPDQPYFRLFTGLLEQYRLALDPSNQLSRRLEQESDSLLNVKADLEIEAEHARLSAEQKKKEANEAKKDESLEQFDWDDFKILGTISFDDEDDVQSSTSQNDKNIRIQNSTEEVQMIPKTLKEKKKKSGIVQISPITGQAVPIEEFADHLRFEKVHPQYQKELDDMKERRRMQNSALATGDQIVQNLKTYATGEAKPLKDPVMWDGRNESIQFTVAEAVDRVNEDRNEAAHEEMMRNDLKKEPQLIGPVFDRKRKSGSNK